MTDETPIPGTTGVPDPRKGATPPSSLPSDLPATTASQNSISGEPELEARIIEEKIEPPPTKSAPLPPATTPPPIPITPAPMAAKPPIPTPPSAPPPRPQPPLSAPSAPRAPIATPDGPQERIAEILKSVKLPERAAPEKPVPERKGVVFDTALGAAATLEKPPEPREPQKRPEAPMPSVANAATQEMSVPSDDGASPVTPLRTLKNDLQEIVRDKKISLVRAVALEQEKRQHVERMEVAHVSGETKRTRGILFAAVLLVLLGASALFGVYIVSNDGGSEPAGSLGSSILFAESTAVLPLEGESPAALKGLIAQSRQSQFGALGSITRIVPVRRVANAEGTIEEQAATVSEFLEALGTRAPEELKRALGEEFFLGIHVVDENAPILVIPVASYERAFAGMLAWESTLNTDLTPAFTAVPPQTIGAGGLPEVRRFTDTIMHNYDVRALEDDAGEVQLFYSFPTRSILIIGESRYSFTEVLSRLRAERRL